MLDAKDNLACQNVSLNRNLQENKAKKEKRRRHPLTYNIVLPSSLDIVHKTLMVVLYLL